MDSKDKRIKNNRGERQEGKKPLVPAIATTSLFLAAVISFLIRQAGVTAAHKNLAELEREIERYRTMNVALEHQVEILRSPDYIEKIARDKLGLVKPGEIRYMVVNQIAQ